MTAKEVFSKIQMCLEKLDMSGIISMSFDPDEYADIAFDSEGYLWINHDPTPYKAKDFERIYFKRIEALDEKYIVMKLKKAMIFAQVSDGAATQDDPFVLVSNKIGISAQEMTYQYFKKKYKGTDKEYIVHRNALVAYFGNSSSFTVPKGIWYIGENAFKGNKYIESITLPKSVSIIQRWAFENCKNLSSINLNHVRYVDNLAFNGCDKLPELAPDFETDFE